MLWGTRPALGFACPATAREGKERGRTDRPAMRGQARYVCSQGCALEVMTPWLAACGWTGALAFEGLKARPHARFTGTSRVAFRVSSRQAQGRVWECHPCSACHFLGPAPCRDASGNPRRHHFVATLAPLPAPAANALSLGLPGENPVPRPDAGPTRCQVAGGTLCVFDYTAWTSASPH